jgi:Family of unknown function (DUF5670)
MRETPHGFTAVAPGGERRSSDNGNIDPVCRMHSAHSEGARPMLYTIAVVLLVLWLLGLVSGYTLGAFVHILLVIAVVLFLAGFVSGRRVV